MTTFDYARYLAAKTTVDDRALNRMVLARLGDGLPPNPRVLEIGAGLGTMVARLLDWGVITTGTYTLLDVDGRLLADSRAWLLDWATGRGLACEAGRDGLRLGALRSGGMTVRFVEAELGAFLDAGHDHRADVLIANAVLDVVDVAELLPQLLRMLAPGGRYWFTINYDGDTIFAPDHPLDELIMAAYHRDMDERVRYGRPAGEARTGRHLFGHLRALGAPVVAAGSSDWVVHADADGRYPYEETYFVECILRTIDSALRDRLSHADLAAWLAARRDQLRSGELVYLAHQLDVVGFAPVVAPDP